MQGLERESKIEIFVVRKPELNSMAVSDIRIFYYMEWLEQSSKPQVCDGKEDICKVFGLTDR